MKHISLALCAFLAATSIACGGEEDTTGCATGVWENNYSHRILAVRLTAQDGSGLQLLDISTPGSNTFSYLFRDLPEGDYSLECGQVVEDNSWLSSLREITIGIRGGQTTRLDCNMVYAEPPTEGPTYESGCRR